MNPLAPFIALDGLDGTGKSTQCRLLVHWLQEHGISAIGCADPGGTSLGDQLRQILLAHRKEDMALTTEAMLFMASRAELVHRIIRPALESNTIVISDRFILANVVYQGHAGGMNPEELWQVGRIATNQIEPNLTFVFDLPIEQAIQRRNRGPDRMEAKGLDYLHRIRQGFLTEAQKQPDRIHVLDATGDIATIQEQLRKHLRTYFRTCGFPFSDVEMA